MDEIPSARRQLAERVAAFIREQHLDSPFGGDVRYEGRYYSVGCSIPRALDGNIRVYGRTFIQVQLQGPLVSGIYSEAYGSEGDLLAFLKALLVDHDQETAFAVPVRPR